MTAFEHSPDPVLARNCCGVARAMADQFPEVTAALSRLPNAVLDGELVVPTAEGRSDFEELRRRNLLERPRMIAESAARRPAVLVVFDLLRIGDEDLRALPLFERRRALHPSRQYSASRSLST